MDDHGASKSEDGLLRSDLATSHRARALSPDALGSVTAELVARLVRRIPDGNDRVPRLQEPPPRHQVEAFCDALISPDPARARAFFDALRADGVSPDRLCLGHIAPAARLLGERWVDDTTGFLEVTLGLARLHGLLRLLHADFSPHLLHRPQALRALFAAVPGDTHVLGVTMAADFFRRAGWQIDLCRATDEPGLCTMAEEGGYRLIGLSVACATVYDRLESVVPKLRALCPDAKIVLSGRLIETQPDIVDRVGADAAALDITVAPFKLQHLVAHEINH